MYQLFASFNTSVYSSKLLINHSIYYLLHFHFLHKAQQSARSRQLYIHWQTLIISLALCYYFRLPTREQKLKKGKKETTESSSPNYDRTKFEEEIDKKLWDHICPEELSFKKTVCAMLNAFYAETLIPGILQIFLTKLLLTVFLKDEIARTDALVESIFCLVMCIGIFCQ
jgi:hypothetical protein